MKPKTNCHVDNWPLSKTHSNIHTYKHYDALGVFVNSSSVGSAKL